MDDMHKIPNLKDVILLKYTQICDIFMVKNGSFCEGGRIMDFYSKTRFWNDEIDYVIKYNAQDFVLKKDKDEGKIEYFAHSDCACGSGD